MQNCQKPDTVGEKNNTSKEEGRPLPVPLTLGTGMPSVLSANCSALSGQSLNFGKCCGKMHNVLMLREIN